ncbi:MBL fold metallo-hydrolase [Uliginosibacterium sp. H1]|uniref:MBL fold metallo-hydrolase n=1 Tax=Uliginosibacterium sp. H1 TaxID=3114757 RepID=UPI002E19CA1B|nr:MBL fold metallo-hydrolase [Uliginosibacterium sp. H1]
MQILQHAGPGIYTLDSGYVRPRFDAIHLVEHAGRVALVDTATTHSVPLVMSALAELGLAAEAVDWILLTHVHLDHAGGAGALMQALPNARLAVHPRGARHMIDPTVLWASTVQVYGQDFARRAYGEVLPAPATRVVEATDGLHIDLAGRVLEVADTPGHARHHVCYYDALSRGWFTGDTFGLSYRQLDAGGRAFVFPTTTPIQFDPQALHASIDRLSAREPVCMFLTHYGRVEGVPRLAADLQRLIDAMVAIAHAAQDLPEHPRLAALRAGLCELVREESRHSGWALRGDAAAELLADDIELNAQGLSVWIENQRKKNNA